MTPPSSFAACWAGKETVFKLLGMKSNCPRVPLLPWRTLKASMMNPVLQNHLHGEAKAEATAIKSLNLSEPFWGLLFLYLPSFHWCWFCLCRLLPLHLHKHRDLPSTCALCCYILSLPRDTIYTLLVYCDYMYVVSFDSCKKYNPSSFWMWLIVLAKWPSIVKRFQSGYFKFMKSTMIIIKNPIILTSPLTYLFYLKVESS